MSLDNEKRREYKSKKKDKRKKSDKEKRKHDDRQEDDQTHKHQSHKSFSTQDGDSLHSESVEESSFRLQTSSLYVPLSPISQLHPLQGLCAEQLSPLILTYYAPLHGVILSYCNVRLSEQVRDPFHEHYEGPILARSVDEYGASFVWITADFLTFSPQRGAWIEGWINLQNESHLGLVCWNLFSASIDRKWLPQGWKWVDMGKDTAAKLKTRNRGDATLADKVAVHDESSTESRNQDSQGYFESEEGKKVEGLLRFKIRDVEASLGFDREKGFLSIEGSLLEDQEEELLHIQ